MKILPLNTENHDTALLIFDGFGGSTKRVETLDFAPQGWSVFFVYDYTNEDFNLDLSGYKNIYLLAWSLGVWQAAVTLGSVNLTKAVAINGTLNPIDANFGIAPEVYQGTLTNWSEIARKKFERRIGLPAIIGSTNEIEAEKNELIALRQRIETTPEPKNIYQQILIGSKDRIFLAENQQRFWSQTSTAMTLVDAPHYLHNLIRDEVNFG